MFNFRLYKILSQPVSKSDLRTSVIAVVKANAYGHGAVAVARALEEAGASMLACADIEEGVQLREAGINVPILVFGALNVSDLNGIVEHGLFLDMATKVIVANETGITEMERDD